MSDIYLDNKDKKDCNGCGVCALKCPVNAITMKEDEEGFLYPEIDEDKCIKCNLCKRVCSNTNDKKEDDEKAYISINKSNKELNHSSSGGMFFILARYVIEKKGVVFGVEYDSNLQAVHGYAESLEECRKFCGSKYVRSDLKDSYQKAKKFLDEDRYVLFTGTACQINGLKKYLGKEFKKLILCDVLCHANPSPKIFNMYKKNLENIKKKRIKTIWFRSKENGWKNQTPIIEYQDGEKEEENTYFLAFVGELINRPSCYDCSFATKRRISDFTIGDFWGIENVNPNIDSSKGVSLLTVNSEKGKAIFEEIKYEMEYQEVNYDLACSYNRYCKVQIHPNRKKIFKGISNGLINDDNIIKYMKKYTKLPIYRRCIRKAKKILKKYQRKIKANQD